MRHAKPQPVRNKIDLADPGQTRSLKKRLGISADDLQRGALSAKWVTQLPR
jgi:hypothetical protein